VTNLKDKTYKKRWTHTRDEIKDISRYAVSAISKEKGT
jgi:hypothetical protein